MLACLNLASYLQASGMESAELAASMADGEAETEAGPVREVDWHAAFELSSLATLAELFGWL